MNIEDFELKLRLDPILSLIFGWIVGEVDNCRQLQLLWSYQ